MLSTHIVFLCGEKESHIRKPKRRKKQMLRNNIPIYIILLIGGIIAILFIYAAIRIKEVRRSKRRRREKSYERKNKEISYICVCSVFFLLACRRLKVFAQPYGSVNIVAAVSKNEDTVYTLPDTTFTMYKVACL